ncbi:retropepsin-like aspartic protease, partial [Aliivibrio sifiae]|uniref:retropepsin-like aspartic protease n=1 Tax=Aliivibrio sifiae TaxID=566293 RepID=UPI0024E15503
MDEQFSKFMEVLKRELPPKLPPKLGDPGKFTIPCTIGKAVIKKALCDLGASVSLMPHTVFQRIGVGELRPTRMTLQLADASTRLPLGIVEDMPVQVGKFFVPGDFVVMDMEEDKDVPIILGRPFLRTARTVFDTYEGTLTMNIGGEKVQFQVVQAMSIYSAKDIKHMTTDKGVVTADCQFCGKHYEFDPATLGFEAT